MQSTTRKAAASVLFCSVAMALAAQAVAADAPGVGNKNVNALTQPIYANPDGDEATKGVKTLQDYIVQEKELFDFLFENHPVFKYAAEGRIKGVYKVSTRGSEFLGEGNAQKYTKAAGAKPSASRTSSWVRNVAANATRSSTRSGSAPVMLRRSASRANIRKSTTT